VCCAECVELWSDHGRGRAQPVHEHADLGELNGVGTGQLYADHRRLSDTHHRLPATQETGGLRQSTDHSARH